MGRRRAPHPGRPTPRHTQAASCGLKSGRSQHAGTGPDSDPKPGRGTMGRGQPPFRAKKAENGTRAGNAEGHEPPEKALQAPCIRAARSARPTATHGGGMRVCRGSMSANTGNRQRERTGSPPALNCVAAGEGKGHPGGTTRKRHCKVHRGREEPKGRGENRSRPLPSRTAMSAAQTRPGQGSSSTQCYAPAPRLGSLRARPWGSHW